MENKNDTLAWSSMKIHHDPSQRWPCEALSSWETFTGFSCIFRVSWLIKSPKLPTAMTGTTYLVCTRPCKKMNIASGSGHLFHKMIIYVATFCNPQTLPFNLRWVINCGVFHPHKCVFPSWNQPWCFSSLSTELLDLSPPIQLTAKEIPEEPREIGSVFHRFPFFQDRIVQNWWCIWVHWIHHFGQTHYLLNQRLHVKEGGAHSDEPISACYKVPNRELTTFGCQLCRWLRGKIRRPQPTARGPRGRSSKVSLQPFSAQHPGPPTPFAACRPPSAVLWPSAGRLQKSFLLGSESNVRQ